VAETLRFDVLGKGDASDLERLANAVDRFADRLKSLDRVKAEPKVDVDTAKAERQVGQFAENLQRRISRAIESLPDIELDADASEADREIAEIRGSLAALSDKRIGVDIDTEAARARVVELQRQLAGISDKDISVGMRADIAAALAELRKASLEVDKLDGRKATVKIDIDRNLSDTIVKVAALGRALGTLALPAAIIAAAPAVAALGGAALSTVGSVGLLPGALLAAGAAGVTAKVALSGVGDALKNVGDAKKFAEALKELSPNARAFATAVRDIGPAWNSVKLDTQQAAFAGLGAEMQRLSKAYLPGMKTGLTGVGTQLNLLAKDLVGFAVGSRSVENVNTIFGNTAKALEAARPAAQNLAGALLDIGVVGSEMLPELAGSLTDATGRFRTFIDEARRSGELRQWIQQGIDALSQLGSIAGNVGKTLLNVFAAQESAGTSLLAKLDELTGAMARWTGSFQGQEVLANVFRTIGETIDNLMPGLQALGQAIVEVINHLANAGVFQSAASAISAIAIAAAPVVTVLGNLASAVLPPLFGIVQSLAPALVPLAAGILGLKVASSVAGPITTLANNLRTFVGDLRGAEAGVDRFGGKLRAAEGGVGKFKTVMGGLAGAIGGGGLGLAITAAVTAVGLLAGAWADAQAEAANQKAAIDSLADSLNSYTGAATEATLAQRAQELGAGKLADGTTSYATALGRAGVSTKDFVQATTGNEQALQKVRTQLDAATATAIKASPAYANGAEQIGRMGISLADLAAAAQGNGPAMDRINDAINRNSAGSLEARSENELLVQSLLRSGGASAEMGQKLNEMAAQYGAAAQQARDAGAANLVFGDVLDVVAQGFKGIAAGAPMTEKMVQGLRDLNTSAIEAANGAGKAAAEFTGVQGGAAAASASMQESRDAFIQAATAAGIAAPQAEELANQVGLIPSAASIIFATNATGVQAEMITLNERIKQIPPGKTITVTDLSDEARAHLQALGFTIQTIPGTKEVKVTAPTEGAKANLDAFVALANGTTVTLTGDMNTDPANGKITQTVSLGNGQTATMTYDANASAADGKIHATVDLGNGQHAELIYDANVDPATGQIKATVKYADGTTGEVTLNPNDQVTPTIDQLKQPVDTPVNLVPNAAPVPGAKAEAAAPVQTPVNLEPVPGLVPGAKAEAATPVQTPVDLIGNVGNVPGVKADAATPVNPPVTLQGNPGNVPGIKSDAAAPVDPPVTLQGNAGNVPGIKSDAAAPVNPPVTLQGNAGNVPGVKADAAAPVTAPVTLTVDASAVTAAKATATQPSQSLHTLNCDDRAVVDAKSRATQPTSSMHTINCNDSAVRAAKAAAQRPTSSTHTIHVVTVGAGPPRAIGAYAKARAMGGYATAAPMAAGGMRRMSAARAEIVPPRQPRIIGDRMRGDEAFIPVNRSARSISILNRAAGEMGYDVVPRGGASPVAASFRSAAVAGTSQRAVNPARLDDSRIVAALDALGGAADQSGYLGAMIHEVQGLRRDLRERRESSATAAQSGRTREALGMFG
jgi:hypothetical protein